MKQSYKFLFSFALSLFFVFSGQAQITIVSDDFPSKSGTLIINEEDTADSVSVDVGLPGENIIWRIDQEFPAALIRQQIVEKGSTPFALDFPDANLVTRYVGRLGSLIHSYYLDNTQGLIYVYQKKTADCLLIQGIGLDSARLQFSYFSTYFTGTAEFVPGLTTNIFPIEYGDSLNSTSQCTVEDTVTHLVADIKDSVFSIVDGWGTVILPSSSYECLRVKSYITLIENLYLAGNLFRSRTTRTINYTWIAKEFGIVARIISHSDETNDNFRYAKQVTRLRLFNPTITLSTVDTTAAPGDTLEVPVNISDLTNLNISSIKMHIVSDASVLKAIDLHNRGTLTALWRNPGYTFSDSGIAIELSGDNALSGQGTLCYVKFIVNPNAKLNDSTMIILKDIEIVESGPTTFVQSGKFIVRLPTNIKNKDEFLLNDYRLYQNYPNPFNAETMIFFQISSRNQVTFKIYNSIGELVRTLVDEPLEGSLHKIKWDGKDLTNQSVSSGIYFYQLIIDNSYKITKKMILLR